MTGSKQSWIKPAVLAVALLGAGSLGVAAAAKSGDWGNGHCGAKQGGHMSGGSWFKPGQHVEGRLAFLKAELRISEDQGKAWRAFAAVVRESGAARSEAWQAHRERRNAMKGADRPALDQRIDHGIAAMEQRFEAYRDLAEAAKTLYAELTPEQQQIADNMLSRRHGHGHGRHFRF